MARRTAKQRAASKRNLAKARAKRRKRIGAAVGVGAAVGAVAVTHYSRSTVNGQSLRSTRRTQRENRRNQRFLNKNMTVTMGPARPVRTPRAISGRRTRTR